MRAARWRWALAAALALMLLPAGGLTSPQRAAAKSGKPVVVRPQQGQLVHRHPVRIVVRSGDGLFDLKAKLNKKNISGDFGPTDKGKRSLRISRSHGLKRGKNVLRVKVRKWGGKGRKTAKRTFFVKHRRPLAGAGRDRRIVEDVRFKQRASALPAPIRSFPSGGPREPRYRWRLTRAPRLSRFRKNARASGARVAGAPLSDPTELRPSFTPDVPGRYRFKLRASQGSRSTSDVVTLNAVPPLPLVPIDTMANVSGDPGIKVGEEFYRAGFARVSERVWYQVLVLDRATLGLVSNKTYVCQPPAQCPGDEVNQNLAKLDDTKLVIAVNQPGPRSDFRTPGGSPPFQRIGVPIDDSAVDAPLGGFSAIGVPGLPQGQADYKLGTEGQFSPVGTGRMTGYLVPDQYFNYTWLPPERPSFDTRAAVSCAEGGTCTHTIQVAGENHQAQITNAGGFQVEVFDRHTLDHRAGDLLLTNKGTSGAVNGEVNRMANFLRARRRGDLIFIAAMPFGAPIGGVADNGAVMQLAQAVASGGGTVHAFLSAVFPANQNSKYSLVGWGGAGEGNGEETSALKHPNPGDGRLRGALSRDHNQQFRPATTSPFSQPSDQLMRVMLQPPTAWPLDGDKGAQSAIAWIGSQTVPKLGPDPRSAYWAASKDQSFWNSINGQIKSLSYPGDGKAGCHSQGGFCEPDFNAAKAELAYETLLVGNVRLYLTRLAQPFGGAALSSWGDLTKVADDVDAALKPPNDLTHMLVLDIIGGVLDIIGVATAEKTVVAEVIAVAYTVALDYISQARDGSDTDDISAKADDIKNHLRDTLLEAEVALTGQPTPPGGANIGDIIVGDYAKLKLVGENANCNPADTGCAAEWGLPDPGVQSTANGVYKSIDAEFHKSFMSLAFPSYRLTPPTKFTDPRNAYTCGQTGIYAFEDEAGAGFVALLEALPPGYDVYALANTSNGLSHDGKPQTPPQAVTARMFGPPGSSPDPKQGGLGVYAPDFFREANRGREDFLHAPNVSYRRCWWAPR